MSIAIIYVLGRHDQVDDHKASAGYIAKKLIKKTEKYDFADDEVPVFESASTMKAFLETSNAKHVSKVFILTHGNWEVVEGRRSDMPPSTFASHLWHQAGFRNWVERMNVETGKVNLLACMSGSPHPENSTIYVEQLSSAFSDLLPQSKSLLIRGVNGLSFTSNTGKNHVFLTEAVKESDIKALDRELAKANGKFSSLSSTIKQNVAGSGEGKPGYKAFNTNY